MILYMEMQLFVQRLKIQTDFGSEKQTFIKFSVIGMGDFFWNLSHSNIKKMQICISIMIVHVTIYNGVLIKMHVFNSKYK